MPKAQNPAVIAAVAAEIKFRRGELKISQEELAHRTGVNRTFIAKIEVASTQPSIAVLFRLAQALEVDAAVLVAGIEQRYKVKK
jgi:transcriptional regulator with XRE-family HTH domain